jgi:SAM-dependent methyltransferase
MAIDGAKLEAFMGKAVVDLGATLHAALVMMGDRLGIYKAMAGAGWLTSQELASRTGLRERYLREWMAAQAAGGYLEYQPATGRFLLPEEQAFALADESSPAYLPGGFELAASVLRDEPRISEAVRAGRGFGWHEHDAALFSGTERFFRPNYLGNLLSSWIPSLEGVEETLRRGGRVADVGCGHGASTLIMAREFPASHFHGFDYHPSSIEAARAQAQRQGLVANATFDVAPAREYPGGDYDLVCFFDCLHDLGDPVGAARHVLRSLAPGGSLMVVEPFAHERLEDNLNPVGRIFYSASLMICTPASLAQEGEAGLGAQAGEATIREVLESAGFTHFRRAAETPFNLVFQARA